MIVRPTADCTTPKTEDSDADGLGCRRPEDRVCSAWRRTDADNNVVFGYRPRRLSDDRSAWSKLVVGGRTDADDDVDQSDTTTTKVQSHQRCQYRSSGRFDQTSKRRSIKTALVAVTMRSGDVVEPFLILTSWLVQEKGMLVYVDTTTADDVMVRRDSRFAEIQDRLICFDREKDDLSNKIDLVCCLGGDTSLLYTSSRFLQDVPPVMAFDLGRNFGFLTTLDFSGFRETINNIIDGRDSYVMLRSRLDCVLTREDSCTNDNVRSVVLNDVVVDRGFTSFLCNLDVYVDSHLVTTVQGDGMILSTPTGSTAYAASAGASMVHPSVTATLIIPICPHTLSFRPIIVPAGVTITVKLSPNARSEAWVSFDGNNRTQLLTGDRLTVTTSPYPLPVVCAGHPVTEWFDSLAHCLNWNVRKQQKPLSPS